MLTYAAGTGAVLRINLNAPGGGGLQPVLNLLASPVQKYKY